MAQQQTKARALASSGGSPPENWLAVETHGRERFRVLLKRWLERNNWSLAVTSRLAELALLATSDTPVPDWTAGMPLAPGAWVNHKGHAWEAIGTPLSEPADGDPGWKELGLTSRLHASGLNLFLRGKNRTLTSTFFLEVGRLNEWVADVKAGKHEPPADPRLMELVTQAAAISDDQGALGPEEMLSIAVGRIQPPPWPGARADAEPGDGVPARQLRAAAAAAGLDIIEDWPLIAAMYPTTDPARLERLQHVLRGLAQWDQDQEEDERLASLTLLQNLQQHTAKAQEAATAATDGVAKEITSASS